MPRTWRTMMSRNVRPSLTSTSDFGPLIPMLVPRPPLSLMTTAWSSAPPASSPASGRSLAAGTSSTGSISLSGRTPVSPSRRRSYASANACTAASPTPSRRILSVLASRPVIGRARLPVHELAQPRGVRRRGRLVLVLEVAVDVEAVVEQPADRAGPALELRVVVRRVAQTQVAGAGRGGLVLGGA